MAQRMGLQLAGWTFFVAENALLSENRNYIINYLGGEEEYHLLYGTISTLATGSIAYSYYRIPKTPIVAVSRSVALAGWMSLSFGLMLASQALPKLQIPVLLGPTDTDATVPDYKFQIRCPFDFSASDTFGGVERISRHSGLWSLAACGWGMACVNPAVRWWWLGPTGVALVGGAHQDSRVQRGLASQTYVPDYYAQTSNVPFGAMSFDDWPKLVQELKPLNCAVAVGAASVYIWNAARRGRIGRF